LKTQRSDEGLIRGIRRWDLVAVAINAIIGAGIFGLPSKVYALIGPYSLIAVAACALVVSLLILCFAEVSSRFSETGGPYLYAREAFGAVAGFEVGWLLWLVRITGFATNCNLLVGYLGYFWPAAGLRWPRVAIISFVVASLTLVNVIGVRDAARVTNVFTVGKLIPIALFIAAGLFFIHPQYFSFATVPNQASFSTAVLLLVYAFTGFEMAVIPAGETQAPRRNSPHALLVAMGVVALIYILIQFVSVGTLPGPELKLSERPLADAAGRFLGAAGASVITAGALISIIGNLNTIVLSGSRLPFAMAEQRDLPRFLSLTHTKFRTPYVAILVTGALMLALTVWSSFLSALTLTTVARLIVYASTCAALPVFRYRQDERTAMFRAPAGWVASIASLLLIGWLLWHSNWKELRLVGIAAAVGMVIYFGYRIVRSK
jgi:basic amino acid/polyamine antiporter, APA family